MNPATTVGPAVLAVDGGNSKTDLLLVAADGTPLAAVNGPTVSHQAVGLEAGMARLGRLVGEARRVAGLAPDARAEIGVYCLAGADLPRDVRALSAAIGRGGFAARDVVLNDGFAGLRAGTERPWGVAVVCGAGDNAVGIGPDGRTARLASLGSISGDRAGGGTLGMEALAAAVRARDGRGARTALERLVPDHFGLRRPIAVTEAIYTGRLDQGRLRELAPVVFAAAMGGDVVAREIVDRLADELVTMAGAIIRRLHLTRLDVEVVLSGGVFRTDDVLFRERIAAGIRAIAPRASVRRLAARPVLGAALLGLDRLAGPDRAAAGQRLRAGLEDVAPVRE